MVFWGGRELSRLKLWKHDLEASNCFCLLLAATPRVTRGAIHQSGSETDRRSNAKNGRHRGEHTGSRDSLHQRYGPSLQARMVIIVALRELVLHARFAQGLRQ